MSNRSNTILSDCYTDKLMMATATVLDEFRKAKEAYPSNFINQHEGYAVILEEVDELWTEIKKNQKQYDLVAQRKEAVHVAAMCLRFIVELT